MKHITEKRVVNKYYNYNLLYAKICKLSLGSLYFMFGPLGGAMARIFSLYRSFFPRAFAHSTTAAFVIWYPVAYCVNRFVL